jgi:integrase
MERTPPKGPRLWTTEQLGTFLDATVEHPAHLAWRTMAATGLRTAEVCELRWSDVNLEHGTIAVPAGKTPGRTVHLEPPALAALGLAAAHNEQWTAGGAGRRHVFTTEAGRPWRPETLSRAFHRVTRALELPGAPLHVLRQIYAAQHFSKATS